MSWENVELRDVSEYRNDRIETNLLNEKNYVSTENMLPNKGGITDSSYPPSGKNSPAFNANDILVSNIRPYFKKIWFAQNEGGCSNDVIVFKPNKEKIVPKFLYFQLSKDEFFDYMMSGANGTKMPRGNKKAIPKFKFSIPTSLETQKRIASIISTYDDLIVNNLKRIKLLEETAQNIYKEWFVNFRFPNYENTEFHSESGLPVGWEKIQVRDYVSVISKGPSLNYETDGNKFPVLNQSCIRNGEIELEKVLYANELNINKDYCYLNVNDILVNSMGQGTLGRVSKNVSITEKFIIHNCITFLRAKSDLSQYQLFYFISNNQKYFESVGQGSTGQTTLKVSLIEELEIIKPTKSVINSFDFLISPLWKQIGILKNQNQKLKEARDILLPRFMNRTIEV